MGNTSSDASNIENTIISNSTFINCQDTTGGVNRSNYVTAYNTNSSSDNRQSKWSQEFIKVNKWPIGQGAFGKVWIVKSNTSSISTEIKLNERLVHYYAMKEINLDLHVLKMSKKNLNYALHEGKKMQNLNHKNVIAYISSYNDIEDQKAYLIMEYANGGSLRDRISLQLNKRDHCSSSGSLFFKENLIWFWLLQILEGISYIHTQEIIHRDIKPDNIFIDARNGTCKLGDFGLSKILEDNNQDYVSQVGTPAYMPPEVLEIRQAQLQYQSVDTINHRMAYCSFYNKKGDIYSFGCTIYELTFLKPITYRNGNLVNNSVLDVQNLFSSSLKDLIDRTLLKDPSKRPSVEEILKEDSIKMHLNQDYSNFYYEQMIPSVNFEKNFSVSLENSSFSRTLICNEYKPSELISLKRHSSNLIILSVNKYMNRQRRGSTGLFSQIKNQIFSSKSSDSTLKKSESFFNDDDLMESEYSIIDTTDTYEDDIDDSKLLIYTEFGELINEVSCYYLDNEKQLRKEFFFQILGMCVDELNTHLYLSLNKPSQICRYSYSNNFSYLILDGILDLNELNQMRTTTPTCLNLLTSNTNSNDYRILFFGDRLNKCLTSIKVSLKATSTYDATEQFAYNNKIKCAPLRSVTVDEKFYPSQILTTNDEILCLFDDLATVQIYDLSTYLAKRDNKEYVTRKNSKVKLRLNYFCMDSDYNFYTTNGHSFLSMSIQSLKFYQKFKPMKNGNQLFFESISFMNILANGKLVLVKDAIQTENSELFIIKPEFYNR